MMRYGPNNHVDFEPTFTFELNDLRHRTISGLRNAVHDSILADELLASDDPIERLVGDHLSYRANQQPKNIGQIADDGPLHDLEGKPKSFLDLEELASRNPMTDATDGSVVDAKLGRLEQFIHLIKAEFGSKFIGLVVAGSLARGYAEESSDADIAIIGQDQSIKDFGLKYACDFGVEHFEPVEAYVHCDPALAPEFTPHETDDKFNPLFQGIFQGDKAKLSIVQSRFIDGVSPAVWDKTRMRMLSSEMASRHKRRSRLDLSVREDQNVQFMALLQRVPPKYAELR